MTTLPSLSIRAMPEHFMPEEITITAKTSCDNSPSGFLEIGAVLGDRTRLKQTLYELRRAIWMSLEIWRTDPTGMMARVKEKL